MTVLPVPRKPCVIVMGITGDHAFAAGCVLEAVRRHSPNFITDVIIYTDGTLPPRDAALLTDLGAVLTPYSAPDYEFRPDVIAEFSYLTLARFECLRLLKTYNTAIWLDVDIAIQRDISSLASFGPLALCLEDPLATIPPYHPTKASFNAHAPLEDLDGEADNCNAGILVFQHTLPEPEQLYTQCMQWLERYAPVLRFSDQAVINILAQHLARRDPSLVQHMPHHLYNAHPKNPEAWNAVIVHGFSAYKFWSNGLAGCCYPEWERDYQDWLGRGGSPWHGPVEDGHCRKQGALPTLLAMMANLYEAGRQLAELKRKNAAMEQELAREQALRKALERALNP